MKKQFLKIAGVKTEAAFYKKYPTEAAFFAAHPEAKKMAMGGTPEAYPQIATFDKAFSYGVKPGPQYLAHGGSAYPMAQTEAQFFIPIYTDVYNPYNKAMGGSNVEMYPNAKTTPHWGPTNVWFQDGGQEGMPQEQQGQELDRAGAQNRTGAFVSMLKSTAAKSNARTAMNQAGMAKYGKQLDKFVPGGQPNYTVSGNITPYINQQMSPTSSRFNPTPYYGVDPPSYDHQLLNNMRSRGILYDPAYAAAYNNPYQGQGFYPGQYVHFAPGTYNSMAGGYMNNFLPSIYDWNNMNQFMFQTKGSPRYKWRTDVPGQGRQRGVSNMDFLDAIFPELVGDRDAQMKAINDPKYADRRKQWGIKQISQKRKGLFGKRRQTDIYFGDDSAATPSTFPNWGTGTGAQQPAAKSNQSQTSSGVPPLLQDNPAYRQKPGAPTLNNPIPGLTPPAPTTPGIKIPYAPNPAPTTSSNQLPQTGVTQPATNTVPAFDQSGAFNQISSNEQNFFGTKDVNEILGPSASQNWQDYPVQNYDQYGNKKGASYDTGDKVKANWESMLANDPNKKAQWEAFKDMPAPIKTIAQDQLFNSSFDPRVIALAAAGVDKGYTGKGAPVLNNSEYRSWLKKNTDNLWNSHKDLINQQYNDDPQAFTETVSANRDIAYQKIRTPDKTGKLTDIPSSSGGPGTQYPAWTGRTKATQDYVDKTYFDPTKGYVAPQFFQNAASSTQPAASNAAISQAPSNANSMDAATAQKKASMMNPNVNQAYIDAQRAAAQQATSIQQGTPATNPQNITQADIANMLQISPSYKTSDDAYTYSSVPSGKFSTNSPNFSTKKYLQFMPNNIKASPQGSMVYYPKVGKEYYEPDYAIPQNDQDEIMNYYFEKYKNDLPLRTPVGPIANPEGFGYGGYTGYKFGGSYNKGDVVYMTDDEIAEFVRNGGQIEEID